MTWIKICGITNLEDALVAVEAGADAVGFVFYNGSPRNISARKAWEITQKLPPKIEKVGVFVNQQEDAICSVADEAGLTAVQLHGQNEDSHVADLVAERGGLKVLMAIAMNGVDPAGNAMMLRPDSVHAFLADSGSSTNHGGTGKTFEWHAAMDNLLVLKRLGNLVLAGGLTPENVRTAIEITEPWGVDVSSGVEKKPGKKEPEKVRSFITAVRESDKAKARN